MQKMKHDERIVEIRKDITFKKDYKSQCIIIMAILVEWERIDNELLKMN